MIPWSTGDRHGTIDPIGTRENYSGQLIGDFPANDRTAFNFPGNTDKRAPFT